MEHSTQSENEAADRKRAIKAAKIPFVAWGISLAAHLLILFFVSNIFWAGRRGLGTEGKEYEVGIAIGSGTDAVTTDPGAVGAPKTLDAQVVNEMAFESEVSADVDLKHFKSDFSVKHSPSQIPSLESLAMGQTTMGQGQWAQVQIAGGGKGQGGASFFGLEAKGGEFVYVVDRSGSMRGKPLTAAKNELIRSITNMDEGMKFYVFFYNTEPLGMPGSELVRAEQGNITNTIAWIESVYSSGGTDPLSTMQLALSLKPDAIWLLSDGQFSLETARSIARENPNGRVAIHTIGYFNRAGEAVLRKIASENSGKYRFVQKP